MTPEEKLFQKVSEKIESKFDEIKETKVKEAVQSAFEAYKKVYSADSEEGIKALKSEIEKINASFAELDTAQSNELSEQLKSVESQLQKYEESLKEIGAKVSKLSVKESSQKPQGSFAKEIEEYLNAKLPTEDGVVLFDAMENMRFDAVGKIEDAEALKGRVCVLSARSMFAAIDHTNENSTAGQGIARDMTTMGFKDIPPILNDHVADIFSTPKMEKKAFMTLRIFHTYEDGAGIKTEGTGTFAKSSVQLKSQDFKVFTYGTQYRISMEENEDVPEIVDELNRVIPDRLMNDLDEKVLTDGGDNSAAPWGAFSTNGTYPNVTLFNPYLYAGSNPDADVADVVAKMKLQARSQNFRPNVVLAHDNMYDNYEGLRDSDGNSILDRRVQFSPQGEITGMAALAARRTRVMNENAILVASTPTQILGVRDSIMMQVGLNEDDFATHNMSTKWWGRFAYGVKDALANIYTSDFVADIEILKMSAATALTYTDEVAKGTTGFVKTNITISLLKTAGAVSLIDSNITAYQDAIEAEAAIADLAALQAVIDTVNP